MQKYIENLRILVQVIQMEAKVVVNKFLVYMTNKTIGMNMQNCSSINFFSERLVKQK